MRTTIARLHDARSAAGDDDEFAVIIAGRIFRAEPGEFARFVIIDGSRLKVLSLHLVFRRPGGTAGLRDARAAEEHDGGADAGLVEDHAGFQQFSCRRTGRSSRRQRKSSSA